MDESLQGQQNIEEGTFHERDDILNRTVRQEEKRDTG